MHRGGVGDVEASGMNAQRGVPRRRLSVLGLSVLLASVSWGLAGKTPRAPHPSGFTEKSGLDETPTLPPAGSYQIDPVHSFAYFKAWHHIVGLVRGRFDHTTGTIAVSQDPMACVVDVTIDTYSVNTQFTQRDDDLRGPDFFDVRKFPTMTYQGHGIRKSSAEQWTMDGTLTIRGVSKVVPITFTFKGLFPDTPANRPPRASFHAFAATKRGDFGMIRDNRVELGVPPTPGNDVEIEIDVEANKIDIR